eukprot:2265740-Lingulodinium_polyedra.AAC.1
MRRALRGKAFPAVGRVGRPAQLRGSLPGPASDRCGRCRRARQLSLRVVLFVSASCPACAP